MSVASSPENGRSERRDQLDSWKEIAAYLKRGVRTVQQWERDAGLPVRRLATKKRGAVYAYKREIDAWREQRSSLLAADHEGIRPLQRIKWFAAFALLIAALSAILLWPKPLRVTGAQRLTFEGNVMTPAISPDGRWIVYASPRENADGNLDLWLRSSSDGTQSRLTATPSHEFDPVFSPDSKRLLYTVAETRPPATFELFGPGSPSGTSVYESDLSGHSRLIVADANSARYSPDNRLIACLRSVRDPAGTDSSIEFGIVPANGGEFSVIPLRLSSRDELVESSAGLWSPDSAHVLLNARTMESRELGWWLVSVSSREAVRIDLTEQMAGSGLPGPIPAANFAPQAWLADGTVLTKRFGSDGIAIWAAKLNVRAKRLDGRPAKLAAPVTEPRWLSVSGNTILFSGGEQIAGLQVIPFDFENARPLGPPRTIREVNTGGYGYLSLSRNGDMLAFESRQSSGGPPDVFVLNLDTGKETPITGSRGPKMYTVMSPDGRRAAYGVIRSGSVRPIYIADTANGESTLLCDDCGGRPSAWTPDGDALLLLRPMFRPQRIALLPIAAPKAVDILESPRYSLMDPGISPDGHWVAFTTKEGAAFIAPFRGGQPIPEAEWIRVASSSQHVLNVFWSGDGSRVYSVSKDRQPGSAINSQRFDLQNNSHWRTDKFPIQYIDLFLFVNTNRNTLSQHRIMESESGRLTFNLMEFVGYRLRQFRTAYAGGKGISQEALAKAVGVSTNTISRWETATYKPTVDDLQKLAIFFERAIVEFFPKYEALTTVEEHVDALARKARKLPGEVVKQLYEYVEFLEYIHGDRDDSEARRLMKKTKKARKMKLSGKRKAGGV